MGKFLKLGLVEIVFLLVVIVVILGALSYMHVLTLPNFTNIPLPKKNSNTKTIVPATPVGLACPVSFVYCRNAQNVTFQNHPALAYAGSQNDEIFIMGKATSYNISITTVGEAKATVFTSSFIQNNKCYTATYIAPRSIVTNRLFPPIAKGTPLAKLPGDKFSINGKEFNLLVLLQEKGIDPKNSDKSDTVKCSASSTNFSENGTYLTPNTQNFD